MSSANIFQHSFFPNALSRITSACLNSLDPDQARRLIGPYLGPNILRRISPDDEFDGLEDTGT